MIDTIIFDAEGVVIDTETIWDKGQEEFLRRRGFVYDRGRIKPLLTGRTLAEGVKVMQESYGFGGDPDQLAGERADIVRELFATDVGFIEGFEAFFDKVHYSYKTCIATALDQDLLALVDRHLGLSELFAGHIYTLSDVGFRSKPSPDVFLYAAKQLASKPDRCVVIEDAPHGIEAARRAGMRSIGISTTYEHDKLRSADLVVDGFDGIDLNALESLAGQPMSP